MKDYSDMPEDGRIRKLTREKYPTARCVSSVNKSLTEDDSIPDVTSEGLALIIEKNHEKIYNPIYGPLKPGQELVYQVNITRHEDTPQYCLNGDECIGFHFVWYDDVREIEKNVN